MEQKQIMIYPNTDKPNINDAFIKTYTILTEMNAKVIAPDFAKNDNLKSLDVEFMPVSDCVQSSYFIVILGGDGTMLSIAREAAKYRVPMIGVNLGHLGFMTELELSEIDKIQYLFNSKYSIDYRMMLEVEVVRDDDIVYNAIALNDIIVAKGDVFKIVQIDISADNCTVASFRGDGVIVSTPTGSTAYSISAGGPVIEPTAQNISVTPVCAHALQAKSYVFSAEREISVRAKTYNHQPACLSADGVEGFALLPTDRVFIRRSQYQTQLIRLDGKNFYNILKEKLSGGELV